MGNDPITFAMSGQRSTNELISNFEHPTRFELVSLGYKSRIIDQLYEGCVYLFLSTWRDLNPRDWVCNPVPLVLRHHSTTGAYVLLDWLVTIQPPPRYQRGALTKWATHTVYYFVFRYSSISASFANLIGTNNANPLSSSKWLHVSKRNPNLYPRLPLCRRGNYIWICMLTFNIVNYFSIYCFY